VPATALLLLPAPWVFWHTGHGCCCHTDSSCCSCWTSWSNWVFSS
jgi:hypothetical protein